MDLTILYSIAIGLFYGAQASLYGYMASDELEKSWKAIFTRKFWECFDPIKALKTVLLGALMGGLAGFTGNRTVQGFFSPADLSLVNNFAVSAIVMGVDKLMKVVVRRTPLVKAWNALKGRVLQWSASG